MGKLDAQMINKYFDRIYCINLSDRTDRWADVENEFALQKLNVQRIDAVDGRGMPAIEDEIGGGARGCALSHVKVLKDIVVNGFNRALILEDDVVFVKNLQEYFAVSVKFIPANWEMLYLGGNYNDNIAYHNGPIYRTTRAFTTSSYGVTLEAAKFLLPYVEKLDAPVDVVYGRLHPTMRAYVFNPPLAWQKAGFSDVEQGFTDYAKYLK